jgi:hypothetical protein
MPIDVDREFHLQRLSEHLGREITTDWKPAFAQKDQTSEVPYKDLSWFYELPFVKQYYG